MPTNIPALLQAFERKDLKARITGGQAYETVNHSAQYIGFPEVKSSTNGSYQIHMEQADQPPVETTHDEQARHTDVDNPCPFQVLHFHKPSMPKFVSPEAILIFMLP